MMQALWHNMVGLLTEVASPRVASPIEQTRARLDGEAPPPRPEPTPRAAAQSRSTPAASRSTRCLARVTRIRGRVWAAVDFAGCRRLRACCHLWMLEAVANQRLLLTRSFYNMNRRQIELGKRSAPYA